MFTKQNTKQKVYKTKLKFIKQVMFYKTKIQKKFYIQVMFKKQVMYRKQNTKQKFTNTLC